MSIPALLRPLVLSALATQTFAGTGVWTPRSVERVRGVAAVAMSPDGLHVAYTLTVPRIAGKDDDGVAWTELHVVDSADARDRTFVGGKVNVGAFAWTPDGNDIAFLAKRDGDKQTSLYEIALAGGEAQKKIELETSISAFSFAPDGKRVALVAAVADDAERKKLVEKGFKQSVFEEDAQSAKVWIADPADSKAKAKKLDVEGHVYQVQWSPKDDRLAISVAPTPLVDDEYMRQRVRVIDANDGHVLAKIENPGKMGAIAWSPDAKWIAMIAAQDLHDPFAGRLVLAPSSGGVPAEVLASDWPGDVESFAFEGASAVLYVAHHGVEATFEKVTLEGAKASAIKQIVGSGAAIFTAVSLSKDGQHAALIGSRFDSAPEVWTMSHGDAGPVRRTDSNPWASELRLAKQEVVKWKARDGLDLEGILVHPLDEVAGQRYPLILCVHGGPESHESNGWMTNYSRPGQMAAARGMAVFYPNYRGSTGRGVAFSKASQGDAGGKEFDDLIDAVDHFIASGLADKDKIGITGGSYGGYATAWCSTKYSERFAAGVMFVGISDKLAKIGSTDIPDEDYFVHSQKRPWEEYEFFKERSPITYADRCKTPLLILGGKDDTRVDPSQSKAMYRWLKLRGHAPVRLVQYPGEGHGNRKACGRLDYNVRMLQWLEHYLKGPGGDEPSWDVRYDVFETPSK
jgi:dipeptidyl aminopeptidase/acylaminoacyl peptidase